MAEQVRVNVLRQVCHLRVMRLNLVSSLVDHFLELLEAGLRQNVRQLAGPWSLRWPSSFLTRAETRRNPS
jgi:hypothetical protein